MKVAVYTGSFNPLHKGHVAVVRHMLEKGGADCVYLVVSPQNPFKDPSLQDNFAQRLQAAKDTIRRLGLEEKVKVDDIEFGMPRPSYTIDTLDALRGREPGNKFSLIIGADNLPDILKWREGERILTDYGIAVYPRKGYNMVHDCATLKLQHKNACRLFDDGEKFRPYRIKLLRDAPLVNISSTQIREKMARGEKIPDILEK